MVKHRAAIPSLLGAAVTLLAFAARAYHLTYYGLSGDEAFAAALVDRGLGGILAATTSGDPHPPLFYTLLLGWAALAGDGELALRFPGLAAGVLLVPLTYRLGRWLFAGPGPLLAALWLALSPYQVWYAHEARMYLPAAFFVTLATALLVRWLQQPTARSLAVYAVAALLAAYTHYYALLVLAGHSLLVLALALAARRPASSRPQAPPPPLRAWLLAQAAIALGYFPWLLAVRTMLQSYGSLGWPGSRGAVAEALTRYSVGHTWGWPGSVVAGAGFVLLGALGIAVAAFEAARRSGAPAASPAGHSLPRPAWGWILVAGWALLPAAVGFAASLARPMLTPRYLLVSVAAFALALGLGLAALGRWRPAVGALALIAVLAVGGWSLRNLYLDPAYARSGYDRLARYLATHAQPGDAVVVAGYTQRDMFWYYYRHRLGGTLPAWVLPSADPLDPVRTAAELAEIAGAHAGIWYLETDTLRYDPGRVIEQELATRQHRTLDRWFLGNRLVYYRTAAGHPPPERRPLARFGSGGLDVVLAGAALPADVRPGEVAVVGLLWETARPLSRRYKVAVALRDPAGRTVAAVDREPADGFLPTTAWLPGAPVADLYGLVVPSTALPGEYAVAVTLYDPDAGQPLAAADLAGQPLAAGAVVGRLTVAGPVAPSVGEAAPAVQLAASFGPLRLLGYDPPPDVARAPGQPVGLWLYWLPTGPLPELRLRFSLDEVPRALEVPGLDRLRLPFARGRSLGAAETPLAPAWLPAGRWEPRPLVAYAEVLVPPRAPTGRHRLRLAVVGPDGAPLGPAVELEPVRVVAPARDFAAPAPERPLGARFGDLAELVGYDGPASGAATLRPGESLRFTLRWRAVGESDVSYKVFAHLVGPGSRLAGQRDAPPLGGRRPTSGWVRGEALADPFEVPLAPDAPPGDYVVKVGLYEEASGRRLSLAAGGDAVDLLAFQVR